MDLYALLRQLNVRFERHDHEPVFSCEQAESLLAHIGGASAKNLFLCDRRRRRHLMLVIQPHQRIDLKRLGETLQMKALGMASVQRLQRVLGVKAGSVSLLALINDTERVVEVVVDRELWMACELQCHPLVNTTTLVLPREGLQRFVAHTGHGIAPMDLPEI